MTTTYTQYQFTAIGNRYTLVKAEGVSNYVNIRKETNNPFKGLGNEFTTFDHAQRHYKSPEIKSALLQIETGLMEPVSTQTYVAPKPK